MSVGLTWPRGWAGQGARAGTWVLHVIGTGPVLGSPGPGWSAGGEGDMSILAMHKHTEKCVCAHTRRCTLRWLVSSTFGCGGALRSHVWPPAGLPKSRWGLRDAATGGTESLASGTAPEMPSGWRPRVTVTRPGPCHAAERDADLSCRLPQPTRDSCSDCAAKVRLQSHRPPPQM